MRDADRYLESMMEEDRVRPLPGYLITLKHTNNQVIDLPNGMSVAASEVRPSGLVLVSPDTKEAEYYKATLVTVLVVGADPYKWNTRWWGKTRDWPTNWEEQGIDVGTILAIRPIAGVNQEKGSKFLQLEYSEICAIGQPEGADGPDMLPAPGWVLVQKDAADDSKHSGLHIYGGLKDVLDKGNMTFGTILALPKGYTDGDLAIGDRICFPTHTAVGATEFIEFEGGLRCLPIDDVLGVSIVYP